MRNASHSPNGLRNCRFSAIARRRSSLLFGSRESTAKRLHRDRPSPIEPDSVGESHARTRISTDAGHGQLRARIRCALTARIALSGGDANVRGLFTVTQSKVRRTTEIRIGSEEPKRYTRITPEQVTNEINKSHPNVKRTVKGAHQNILSITRKTFF